MSALTEPIGSTLAGILERDHYLEAGADATPADLIAAHVTGALLAQVEDISDDLAAVLDTVGAMTAPETERAWHRLADAIAVAVESTVADWTADLAGRPREIETRSTTWMAGYAAGQASIDDDDTDGIQ